MRTSKRKPIDISQAKAAPHNKGPKRGVNVNPASDPGPQTPAPGPSSAPSRPEAASNPQAASATTAERQCDPYNPYTRPAATASSQPIQNTTDTTPQTTRRTTPEKIENPYGHTATANPIGDTGAAALSAAALTAAATGDQPSVNATGEPASNLGYTTPNPSSARAANSSPDPNSAPQAKPPAAIPNPSACLAAAFLEDHGNQAAARRTLAKLRKEHEQALNRLESKLHTLQHRRHAREDRSRRQALDLFGAHRD